jgi:hypothetical protein
MQIGFVYIWMDIKRRKFYIGSHRGTIDDGYVGSGYRFKCAYYSRPNTFKRRILEHVTFNSLQQLLNREEYWLSMIADDELHGARYYNEKKVASGGDIISTLPLERRAQHREKSLKVRAAGHAKWMASLSTEEKSRRARHARLCVKNPSGGKLTGEANGFYGKRHSDQTRAMMAEKAKNRKNNLQSYRIIFPDGFVDILQGHASIEDKYCAGRKLKYSRFINTNAPITSNRKEARGHPLIGARIEKI